MIVHFFNVTYRMKSLSRQYGGYREAIPGPLPLRDRVLPLPTPKTPPQIVGTIRLYTLHSLKVKLSLKLCIITVHLKSVIVKMFVKKLLKI